MGPYQGKVVLVTGSSRGIGRATALEFAREGADVVVNYLRKASAAEEVANEIQRMGSRSIAIGADVGDREAVKKMFATIHEKFGHLDVLVSNAAIATFGNVEEVKKKHIDFTFGANIDAVIWCVQEALPLMRGRRGTIITVSSVGVHTYLPNATLYTVAKGAVETLTKRLAFEFMEKGEDVNIKCVRPGLVDTDSLKNLKERLPGLSDQVNSFRHAKTFSPEDIAKIIVWLASDDARLIHGEVIDISGGLNVL